MLQVARLAQIFQLHHSQLSGRCVRERTRLSRPDPTTGRLTGVTTLARHRGAGYVTSGGQEEDARRRAPDRDRGRKRGSGGRTLDRSVSWDKDGMAKGLLKIVRERTRSVRSDRWLMTPDNKAILIRHGRRIGDIFDGFDEG